MIKWLCALDRGRVCVRKRRKYRRWGRIIFGGGTGSTLPAGASLSVGKISLVQTGGFGPRGPGQVVPPPPTFSPPFLAVSPGCCW